MAYNEELAKRIRKIVSDYEHITEKKMFGGLTFLFNGRMFCGIVKDNLMVRVGTAIHEQMLSKANVRPMDFTGRPMKGYVYVEPGGYRTDLALSKWLQRGIKHVSQI